MFNRIKSLWRVTAVRLSVAYTVSFGLLAIFIVFYMTGGAINYLRSQFQESINQEVVSLRSIYDDRGLNGVIRTMEIRSRMPDANLYVVSDPSGNIIAGNVKSIDPDLLAETGWHTHPFEYEGFGEFSDRDARAIARSIKLPNGIRILIGQDIGDPERLQGIVSRALTIAMATMLLVGLLIWVLVGRRALKRIDLVSKSTERILSGDHSERLPVTGSNDEFDRLSKRMNIMLDRISLLDKGLQNVSDSIAHDLKTPLTRLRNKADAALSADPVASGSRDALEDIISDSDQLIKTFNALLMISRVEAGSQVTELDKVNMSELMLDVAELYEPVAEESGFELLVDIAPNIHVIGSRELLSQAMANLLDNSLKYGRNSNGNKPVAKISLLKRKREVVASISDKGDGISESDRDRAKERFSRLDDSRSKPGNGLGLALVEAVAKLHSGKFVLGDAEPGLLAEIVIPVLDEKPKRTFKRKTNENKAG